MAYYREFHFVDVGTISFLRLTSSTRSETNVDGLALVQRAAHLAMLPLYTVFVQELRCLSTLLVEIRLIVCDAHMFCGGRLKCPSPDAVERASMTSVKVGCSSSPSSSFSDSVSKLQG